jgi:anti-sigma factor RsiW
VNVQQMAIAEDDLTAFVDDRLEPARRAVVETLLRQNPTAASRVSADSEIMTLLRERLAPKAAEPIPERLRLANILANRHDVDRPALSVVGGGRSVPVPARPARSRAFGQMGTYWRMAASVLLAAGLGGVGGWRLHEAQTRPLDGDMFGRQAAAAYIMLKQVGPQPLQVASLSRLSQDVSLALGSKLELRDSTGSGFQLIGAWVVPSVHGQAVQFTFRDLSDSKIITMYLENRPGAQDTPFREVANAAMPTVSWEDDGMACAISGLADPKQLERIGKRLYDALLA